MRKTGISWFMALAGLFLLQPSAGQAATKTVDCNIPGKTIQSMIGKLKPGDTLKVINGSTCNENVSIPVTIERITIDGLGSATINGPDNTKATVGITGRSITLTGLTITGGEDVVAIFRGGVAVVAGCTIQGAVRNGIGVSSGSSARVTNNMIQNNTNHGVSANQNSYVRLGFLTFEGSDTVPGGVGPNTIQNNGLDGVRVGGSSDADVINNTISNNGRDGVRVVEVSHALIASNTIDGNLEDGIVVGENSGVNLGRDTGTELDESPNDTTVGQENTGNGIRCFLNSSANGRLGTLNGVNGAKGNFSGTCHDSLI